MVATRVTFKTLRGGYDLGPVDQNTAAAEDETEAMAAIMASPKTKIHAARPTTAVGDDSAAWHSKKIAHFSGRYGQQTAGELDENAEKRLSHAGDIVERAFECASSSEETCSKVRLERLLYAAEDRFRELRLEFKDSARIEAIMTSVLNMLSRGSAICNETRAGGCSEPLGSALKMVQEVSSDQVGRPWSDGDLRSFAGSMMSTTKELQKLLTLYEALDMAEVTALVKEIDADFFMMKRLKAEAQNRELFAKDLHSAEVSYEQLKQFLYSYPLVPRTKVHVKLEVATDARSKKQWLKEVVKASIVNAIRANDTTAFGHVNDSDVQCNFTTSIPSLENSGEMIHTLSIGVSLQQHFAGKAVEAIKYICGTGELEKQLTGMNVPLHDMNLMNVYFSPLYPTLNVSKVAGKIQLYIEKSNHELVHELQHRIESHLSKVANFNAPKAEYKCKGKPCPYGMECEHGTCHYLQGCATPSDCDNLRRRACLDSFCILPATRAGAKCASNVHCAQPLRCILSSCAFPKKEGGTCKKTEDCDPPGLFCGSNGRCNPTKQTGDVCAEDEECGSSPNRCGTDGVCTDQDGGMDSKCTDMSDCNEGFECFTGRCKGGMGTLCAEKQHQCGKKLVCEDGKCIGDIGSRCGCKLGTTCTVANKDDDPAEKGSCQRTECDTARDCPASFVCIGKPHARVCKRVAGMGCSSNTDCFKALSVCYGGTCQSPLGKNCRKTKGGGSPCLPGLDCVFGQCQMSMSQVCNGTQKALCIDSCMESADLENEISFRHRKLDRSNYCGLCCLDCRCDNSDEGWVSYGTSLYKNALHLAPEPAPTPAPPGPTPPQKPGLMIPKDQLTKNPTSHIRWEKLEEGFQKGKRREAQAAEEKRLSDIIAGAEDNSTPSPAPGKEG